MQLLPQVRRFIRDHNLIPRGARVVVALSGGSDSVALAHLVVGLEKDGDLVVAGFAHLDHQLRATSADDERFAAAVADRLGRSFVSERADVGSFAGEHRRSIEDAARELRYEFLARARTRLDADLVALGHTRDDQAETFLLRLVRGAGPRGLAAMHPRNGFYVRPLLDCRRADLRAWLTSAGIAFLDDESNADVAIPRNRVRRELVPLLESRFNPHIVDVLATEAALARDDWDWVEGEAGRFPVERTPDAIRIDRDALACAPRALARAVVWRAMAETAGGRAISFAHVNDALALVDAPDGTRLDAPGQIVERAAGALVLRGRPDGVRHGAAELPNLFRYPLSIPGEVRLASAGWVVTVEAHDHPPGDVLAGGEAVAIVRSDVCGAPLAVRNRRPGDSFRPLGLNGRKKLQDYFVDRKLARGSRDLVPLVVDRNDRIVWVAGHGIDEAFRVTDPAQAVLILRLKLLGGPA